jgi:glycosyltransferase involved in cell wall biosynthesis
MRHGHNVIVALISDIPAEEHPFGRSLAAAGVKTASITVAARAYLRERALMTKLCASEKPDILHTHGAKPDVLHGASHLRRPFGTVTTVHGSSKVGGASTFHEILQMLLLRRFDGVIAVSQLLANELRGKSVRADRLHVIPNAWSSASRILDRAEARTELNLPAEGVVIGWIGRLIPIKGADVFLDAISRLGQNAGAISVIGDGPERARLEEYARDHDIGERVRFHGVLPNAARYMRAFDVFVLSSRSEGTPVTLLEAMAAKVPLVVTSVGGIPDVVDDREALLVPSEAPGELARAIARVLSDPAAAARRAEAAALTLAARFNVDDWIDAHDRVYDAILLKSRS